MEPALVGTRRDAERVGIAEALPVELVDARARIEVRLEGDTAAGIFADLDPTGALVLRQEEGQRLILAGDVFPAEV